MTSHAFDAMGMVVLLAAVGSGGSAPSRSR